VSGINWLRILRQGGSAQKVLKGLVVDAREIVMIFQHLPYKFQCGRLWASAPDSEISAEALELLPLIDDGKFFAASKFRRTRFRIVVPQCKVTGVDYPGLLQGTAYRARSVKANGALIDVLVNKDTPYNANLPLPLMPNEIPSLLHKIAVIESLNVFDGRLLYAERYIIGSAPAEVAFDSIELSAVGITNRAAPGATAVIHGQGKFMHTSTMKISMVVPVFAPDVSFRYSGSLDVMDLTELNSFLGAGEDVRIKSGILQSAAFDIQVTAGHASGTVRALYKDLTIANINRRTGSERGAINRITSLIANTLKIRRTNLSGNSGSMKIGKVNYLRKRDDTFLQIVWFSLRSGIGDVIGF
jgi:hypothetical protein